MADEIYLTKSLNPGTGEHGVGVGKKIYLTDELGESTVALLRKIKKTIDPQNIFNPGKVGDLPFVDLRRF